MKRGCLIAMMLMLFAHGAVAASLPCGGSDARQVPATYIAADGKQADACFDQGRNRVSIRLPDGETVSLPLAISASGSRYSDGTRTFWEHQGIGRYSVGERTLFEGKIVHDAGYNSGVTSKLLKKTTVTANGEPIRYLITDKPEVSAVLVEIAPGRQTGWHKHSVPVYAYVLAGEISVELEQGEPLFYKTGDAFVEVVEAFHNGKNNGTEPVRLVVFYTGAQGQENVTRK